MAYQHHRQQIAQSVERHVVCMDHTHRLWLLRLSPSDPGLYGFLRQQAHLLVDGIRQGFFRKMIGGLQRLRDGSFSGRILGILPVPCSTGDGGADVVFVCHFRSVYLKKRRPPRPLEERDGRSTRFYDLATRMATYGPLEFNRTAEGFGLRHADSIAPHHRRQGIAQVRLLDVAGVAGAVINRADINEGMVAIKDERVGRT